MENEPLWTKKSPYRYVRKDGVEVVVSRNYTFWRTPKCKKPFRYASEAMAWLDKHFPA